MLSILLAGLLATQGGGPLDDAAAVHLDELRGFRIEVPAGWQTKERDDPTNGHIRVLLPPGSAGKRAVTVAARASPNEGSAMVQRDQKLALLTRVPSSSVRSRPSKAS